MDTCGGCGSKGTAGSGAQRAALLLADGPPMLRPSGEAQASAELVFTGDAHSHNFPSVAQITVEVYPINDTAVEIALSGSDGTGSTAIAYAAGNGAWIVPEPIFMGTGWGASSDPFTKLSLPRTLILSEDGTTAKYQDMGSDTSLELMTDGDVMINDVVPEVADSADLAADEAMPEEESEDPGTRRLRHGK